MARRSEAKIFKTAGGGHDLKLVKSFVEPTGRLKERELISDRPGRQKHPAGPMKSGLQQQESTNERLTSRFVHRICEYIDRSRSKGEFDSLILMAEPRLLGKLNLTLRLELRKLVIGGVSKDGFAKPPEELLLEIREQLQGSETYA